MKEIDVFICVILFFVFVFLNFCIFLINNIFERCVGDVVTVADCEGEPDESLNPRLYNSKLLPKFQTNDKVASCVFCVACCWLCLTKPLAAGCAVLGWPAAAGGRRRI